MASSMKRTFSQQGPLDLLGYEGGWNSNLILPFWYQSGWFGDVIGWVNAAIGF